MSPESLMIIFTVIGALLLLVCWPSGPSVERECDEHVYGAMDVETTCADLTDGRPCDVCSTVKDVEKYDQACSVEHVELDLTKVSGDRKIKGFRRG